MFVMLVGMLAVFGEVWVDEASMYLLLEVLLSMNSLRRKGLEPSFVVSRLRSRFSDMILIY